MRLLVEEPQQTSWVSVLKTWLIRVAIAVVFTAIGMSKFPAQSGWVEIFSKIGFGQWLRYLTGIMQVAGAVLVLIPRTFAVGIVFLCSTMLGAAAVWVFILGTPPFAMVPLAILLGLLFVGGEELIDLVSSLQKRFRNYRSVL